MKDRAFIDTNIWVYAKITGTNLDKHQAAKSFLHRSKHQIVISTQVLSEFYSALAKNKIENNFIEASLEQLIPDVELQVITLETIKSSWKIRDRYDFSIYDSLIIASALEADCELLFTEDLQHNQVIENKLKITNPFLMETD